MEKETYHSILEFLSKWGVLVGYVVIALVGKFGFDIINKKKLTLWYVFGTSCMAFFVGFLSFQWCREHPALNPGIIVPFASLVSRDVLLFISAIDWMGVLQLVTGKGIKKDE